MTEILLNELGKPCPYCGKEVVDVPGIGLECLGGWECTRPSPFKMSPSTARMREGLRGLAAAARQRQELLDTPLWELEDFPDQAHLLTLASEFRITPRLYVKRRGNTDEWKITANGAWRNHFGEWEVPSLPSSQTDEFHARTSYKFIDAMQIAISLPVSEPDEFSRRGFFNYVSELPPRKENT